MLGEEGRKRVKKFVADGGGYVGICAVRLSRLGQLSLVAQSDRRRASSTQNIGRGTGEVKINLTAVGQKALETDREVCPIYYGQGPLLAPGEKGDINDYELLAAYETEIAKNVLRPAS